MKDKLIFKNGMRVTTVFNTGEKKIPAPQIAQFIYEMKLADVSETVMSLTTKCYNRGYRRGLFVGLISAICGNAIFPWIMGFFK